MDESPYISLKGITKIFPGVRALSDVSFGIKKATCHALMGENGAGKSTLGKIIAGIHSPDEGSIEIDGETYQFQNSRDASAAGVAMVHQELLFCENLCVAENICLSRLPSRWTFVDRKEMYAEAERALERIGADIDPGITVSSLSVSRQQLVQIASAVAHGAKILIFDEPTSSLSHHEAAKLFELMRELKKNGVTLIFVSHRLEEIFAITDAVTVLRDGQFVATVDTKDTERDELVKLMVGRTIDETGPQRSVPAEADRTELLAVGNLSVEGRFADVSFNLKKGEIVGVAGLVGAGRTELGEALFGIVPATHGEIRVNGEIVRIRGVHDALDLGIGLVPEDRKRHGLVPGMKCRENLTLSILERLSSLNWIRREEEKEVVDRYYEALHVRPPDPEAVITSLSGGNQQKIVIARWLAAGSRILIIDEPTRGVDVSARAEIHRLIRELADKGSGILLISSDLPEVLALSDRILVLREGRLMTEMPRENASQEELMRWMTGMVREPAAEGAEQRNQPEGEE